MEAMGKMLRPTILGTVPGNEIEILRQGLESWRILNNMKEYRWPSLFPQV